jgi:haloacetate dehalogenase
MRLRADRTRRRDIGDDSCRYRQKPAPTSRGARTCDRRHDDEDRAADRTITCPTQVLWAVRAAMTASCDPLAIWRNWADGVTGQALDSGHFLPEERPAETPAALHRFHAVTESTG